MENVEMTVVEYIWRNCYQIVCWDKEANKDNFPTTFGSGFFLQYKDKLVFVTADHVLHPDDYNQSDHVERSSKEYAYALVNNITNKKEPLYTVLTPISGFHNCDVYDFKKYLNGEEDIDVASIPEFPDVSISIVDSNRFEYPFLTHELKVDEKVLVNEGKNKLCIKEDAIVLPSKENRYIVLGVVKNKSTGILWNRVNAFHFNLHYEGEECGLYKFCYDRSIDSDNWEGLSGSPFFDETGRLVGMIIRVVHGDNIVWVVPMKEILNKIDFFIRVDNLQNQI